MPYEYREVKCPRCGHVFMWEKSPLRPHPAIYVWYEYIVKATGEIAYEAVCPACGKTMVVVGNVFAGVDTSDERFERHELRGI